MRRKLAFALLVSLVVLASPALSAATTIATEPAPAKSAEPAVDDLLLVGIVTTELVAAVKCPVETLTCSRVDADCGVVPNKCHCKAGGVGGATLVCVKNPGPPPPPEL